MLGKMHHDMTLEAAKFYCLPQALLLHLARFSAPAVAYGSVGEQTLTAPLVCSLQHLKEQASLQPDFAYLVEGVREDAETLKQALAMQLHTMLKPKQWLMAIHLTCTYIATKNIEKVWLGLAWLCMWATTPPCYLGRDPRCSEYHKLIKECQEFPCFAKALGS
jgi:hypothetical protein